MEERISRGKVIALAVAGTLVLLAAGCFAFYSWWQGNEAQQAAQALLEEQQPDPALTNAPEAVSTLLIPSLDLELPVIWEYSEDALKEAVCRYAGPNPGGDGNLVITGHDYLSGAHFGTLDEARIGDEIVLYDADGQKFTYAVYELELITPDDVQALSEYEGVHALTLMTCADNANKRLLLRCRLEEQAPREPVAA